MSTDAAVLSGAAPTRPTTCACRVVPSLALLAWYRTASWRVGIPGLQERLSAECSFYRRDGVYSWPPRRGLNCFCRCSSFR